MTIKNHIIFWAITCTAFIAIIALFKSVLLPFVLGAAIAYFLEPSIKALGRVKISRGWAVLLILTIAFLVVAVFFGILLPILYRELLEFSQQAPGYMTDIIEKMRPHLKPLESWIGTQGTEDWQALISQNGGSAAEFTKNIAGKLAASGAAFANTLSILIITPVMAYFMMHEWPRMTAFIEDLMPRDSKTTITNLLKQIDQKLSSFVRGQISVAVILGVGYAIVLSIAGLKYGFLIGLMAGILSVIPMVGSIAGFVVGVTVAWFQIGTLFFVGIIAAIFIIGQIIEGYILTPKLVGDSVGLHPLWIFFALMAGGSLFGIVGMLIAIPVAAIASVLIAFALNQYKKSPYYKKTIGKKKSVKAKAKEE